MSDPQVTQFRRLAAYVTGHGVLHPSEKAAAVASLPLLRRRGGRQQLEAEWERVEAQAVADAEALVAAFEDVIGRLDAALAEVRGVGVLRVQSRVDDERARLVRARGSLAEVRAALRERDFSAAGRGVHDADRELWEVGGPLLLELRDASFSRELQTALVGNQTARRDIRSRVDGIRRSDGQRAGVRASLDAYGLMADGLHLLAQALQGSGVETVVPRTARIGSGENSITVVPSQELERLDDIGGLETVKDTVRRTLGMRLGNPDEAARYGVSSGNVLFYGPPGTGKTLMARAIAGEYGLRYLRVTPAVIASPYAHEAARNLSRVFELARQSTPCLLFLDEVDSLGSARSGLPSAEHRELVTQLLTLLEEYRSVPRLLIIGATNAVDLLDPALREGRFDAKIPVPLPDVAARRQILEIHLRRRAAAVSWSDIDLDAVVQRTAGRSGAALAVLVSTAAERAMAEGRPIAQADLLGALGEREARDRLTLENPVRWEDVVLPMALQQRLREIVRIVQHPELADMVGVTPPAGILLYGPPGTGKTTIAKALATEVRASFYEMSAADLLSKWVGESEERVAKLFATARENRPSIIFIDEIDGLLRRRSASSSAPWEERVVSQFLRELDGLRTTAGVFLVGATNRIDIIDEAVRDRRLTALEVPLPDLDGRRMLLRQLFSKVRMAPGVGVDELAGATDGLSGADLKRLRDEIGMRALSRALTDGHTPDRVQVTAADFFESLHECRTALIPD